MSAASFEVLGKRCKGCGGPIFHTRRGGRTPDYCSGCRKPRSKVEPTGPVAPADPDRAIREARARVFIPDDANDTEQARAEAVAWRDAQEALLEELFGIRLSPSCRRLPWE